MKETERFRPLKALGWIYARMARKFFSALLFIGVLAALAAAVVLPVWALAVNRTELFTFLVLGLMGGGLLYVIIRRIINVRRTGSATVFRGIVAKIVRFIIHLGFVFWIYGIAVLFAGYRFVPAAALTIGFIVALGYYVYGRSKNRI